MSDLYDVTFLASGHAITTDAHHAQALRYATPGEVVEVPWLNADGSVNGYARICIGTQSFAVEQAPPLPPKEDQ